MDAAPRSPLRELRDVLVASNTSIETRLRSTIQLQEPAALAPRVASVATASSTSAAALEATSARLDRVAKHVSSLERRRARRARREFHDALRASVAYERLRQPRKKRVVRPPRRAPSPPPKPPAAPPPGAAPPPPPAAVAASPVKTMDEALAAPPPAAAAPAADTDDDSEGGRAEDDALAAARAAELALARDSVAAAERVAAKAPPESAFDRVTGFLAPLVRAVAPADPVFATADDEEEAAGWLHRRVGRSWDRQWVALRQNDVVGPFLEFSPTPGARDLVGRLVLSGCDVAAVDDHDGDRFAFKIAHAHTQDCVLSSVNRLTRKQWVGVLTQLMREHAVKSRKADQQLAGAGEKRLQSARRRLSLAAARAAQHA